jgi:lycopene cyclase domain-containing protein
MSYLQFHFVFVLPPIALLAVLLACADTARVGPRRRWALPLLAVIAFLYTTPWDNHLVRRGVWAYGEDRVIGTIGWVPVEEYLFFLLQPILCGLWLYLVLARTVGVDRPPPGVVQRGPLWPAIAWLAAAGAGALMLRADATTYLGLILAWAAPVLAAQWAYARHELVRLGRLAVLAVAVPTLWLWVADAVAIRLGIWTISRRYTVGLAPFGLPVEEAVFFLVTNLLVVQGLVMFLFPRRPSVEPAPPRATGARAA